LAFPQVYATGSKSSSLFNSRLPRLLSFKETQFQAPDDDTYSLDCSDEDDDIFPVLLKDQQSNEPINPGDVIEYFDPLLVRSKFSRCTTVVISVKEPPQDATKEERDDFFH